MKKAFFGATLAVAIMLLSLLIVPIFGASLTTNATSSTDDSPMFHPDPSHSSTETGNPTLTPTLLWNYTTGSYSFPSVANGVVYVNGDVFLL